MGPCRALWHSVGHTGLPYYQIKGKKLDNTLRLKVNKPGFEPRVYGDRALLGQSTYIVYLLSAIYPSRDCIIQSILLRISQYSFNIFIILYNDHLIKKKILPIIIMNYTVLQYDIYTDLCL